MSVLGQMIRMGKPGPQRMPADPEPLKLSWVESPTAFAPCGKCATPFPPFALEGGLCPDCQPQQARPRQPGLAHRDRNRALREQSGVPERYLAVPFDLATWPRDPNAQDLDLREWAGNPWSLLLWGGVGAGKGMLGVELLHRAQLRERKARCVKASEISRICYSSGDGRDELELVDALLVNDLGAGHPSGGWEAIADVLDTRYERCGQTIVTSNRDLRRLISEGGDHGLRIADRLTTGLVVRLAGPSRRTLFSPDAAPAEEGSR